MNEVTSPDARTQAKTGWARTSLGVCSSLALLTACFAGDLQAEELPPLQSRTIALGPVSGAAYYTNDGAASRLVATLGGDENTAPMRVAVTLSVPAGVGEPSVEVTFIRRDGRVFVDDGCMRLETAR